MRTPRSLREELLAHLNIVQGHYSKLFEGRSDRHVKLPDINYGAVRKIAPARPSRHARLQEAGRGGRTLQQWMRGDYRALRNEATKARSSNSSRPDRRPGACRRPDDAVTAFDRFLGALQRGGRLISLLSQNRDLVALVALILGAAPRLGDMLARQPQIMDGLIDPRFFGAMPDQKELSARLAATLKDAAPTKTSSTACACSARRACS
jgi:glutamate-ammonia-ligase adenylyltransferase